MRQIPGNSFDEPECLRAPTARGLAHQPRTVPRTNRAWTCTPTPHEAAHKQSDSITMNPGYVLHKVIWRMANNTAQHWLETANFKKNSFSSLVYILEHLLYTIGNNCGPGKQFSEGNQAVEIRTCPAVPCTLVLFLMSHPHDMTPRQHCLGSRSGWQAISDANKQQVNT